MRERGVRIHQDAVRIVDPPGDLVAQPVKPERWNFINRFLIYERQHALLKVIPEAPSRSQKVMSMLKRSVVEILNRAPFWVIGIVQKRSGKLCVQVALRNDDPKRLGIHVVLFRGHFHVHVTFKKGYDIHLGSKKKLSGEIPASLGNLTNLRYLELYSDGLSGEIPTELGNLANLQKLHLGSNELSGTIPVELVDLTNLRYLELGHNELSGSIPPELGDLTSLQRLILPQQPVDRGDPGGARELDEPPGPVSQRQ